MSCVLVKLQYILSSNRVKRKKEIMIFICHEGKNLYSRGMTAQIYYPTTKFFPRQPQILHQMVLHFFLQSEKYADSFDGHPASHSMLMPYGSYFDIGILQAAAYRYRMRPLNPQHIFLIV